MCTCVPWRDPSYLTAISFFLGANCFVIGGFFSVLEVTQPQLTFTTEQKFAIPIIGCLGDFLFIIGVTTAVWEALNIGRKTVLKVPAEDSDCLSPARLLEHDESVMKEKHREHTKRNQPWPVCKAITNEESDSDIDKAVFTSAGEVVTRTARIGDPEWIWCPSITQLRTRYCKDIAFIASIISWAGIIPFTIATIVYVPGAADHTHVSTFYYAALLQSTLGGSLFFIAAFMQTVFLAQKKWYLPAPQRLVWHVGMFNSVGSIGFALAGALCYAGEDWYWSAALATFWGSWCWWLGSLIAWYIVMDYHTGK